MAVQAQFMYPESLGIPMFSLQDWAVSNPAEADFSFGLQESQQQNLFLQQQSSQNFGFDCNRGAWFASPPPSSSTCDSFLALSQSLYANYLEMQRQEVDCILQFQHERLRSALQEQRKQQFAVLLKSVKSKAISLMRQKEEDLAKAAKKKMELEACLERAQMETESWQRLARENEAMVIDLSNTLEQVKERMVLSSNSRGQDTESSCCGSCKKEQEAEDIPRKRMVCKGCSSRASSVLFLPCRHLCSCKFCEAFFSSCPVCESAKEGSMEVFWV
ncbi:probable BOI-related E3 ubiquitin-protein ligase 2 [Ricinus communis]|uniref:ATP binding protein, putative n=1 Tax=Ricinus communis TaxID=3988 RepID=B9R8C8_RICCO|nr:probable BOI-related E3 ubiquitin-protein ligase 2 [Ricinus communis]EEF52758.1 ATP binding protein, putative [Ricinus communis]|eukprot:XP_002510571.1 probable BOI-related E3 ubiquitin-protein ligase 2 [Ricinus communis]